MLLLLCCFVALAATIQDYEINTMFAAEGWVNANVNDFYIISQSCKTLILLFTDRVWWPLTRDLIGDLHRYGQDRCVAIWYWTDGSAERPADCFHPIYFDDRSFHRPYREDDEHSWGTRNYFIKTTMRVTVARAVLGQLWTSATNVAVVDSDIMLRRNVIGRMEAMNATFVAQQETECPGRAPCVNAGFWMIRPCDGAIGFLTKVIRVIDRLDVSDQDAFDSILSTQRDISVALLDQILYANGRTLRDNTSLVIDRAYMIHVNHGSGGVAEKTRLLKQLREPSYKAINHSLF